MRSSESFSESESMIRRDELLVSRFRGFGCEDRRRDQNAITKSHAHMRSEREIQLLFAITEDFLTKRICGEKPIAARVPISGKAGILRVIENRDRHRFVAHQPAQIAPASARAPGCITLFTLTSKISSVDARVIQFGDRGRTPAGVGKHFSLVGWYFKSTNNAESQHAVFFVWEGNFFIERPQRVDAVDAAKVRPAAEHKVRVLVQQNFLFKRNPFGLDVQLALLRTAFYRNDRALNNSPHLRRIFRLNRVGIVPEIQPIDVLVVKPKTGMMRVVNALARPLLERIPASDDRAF